jgi:hypothetical protein
VCSLLEVAVAVAVADEEVVDLEGGIGGKKKENGTSLLSGSQVVLD